MPIHLEKYSKKLSPLSYMIHKTHCSRSATLMLKDIFFSTKTMTDYKNT